MSNLVVNKNLKIIEANFMDNKTLAYCEAGDIIRFEFNNEYTMSRTDWMIKLKNITKGMSIHMNIEDFRKFTICYEIKVEVLN